MTFYVMHWSCSRCGRRWSVTFQVQTGQREETHPPLMCCEECANAEPEKLAKMRRKNKRCES